MEHDSSPAHHHEPLPGPDNDDICRVCRSGAPEDGQLFWPCRCTGSMRFVHEPCLREWLAVSKKDKCELCNTTLSFENVFDDRMPDRLPLPILIRHIIQTFFNAVVYVLRAVLVATSWLAILPFIVIWVSRFFLWTAEGFTIFALLVSGRLPPGKPTTSLPTTARVGAALHQIVKISETVPFEEFLTTLSPKMSALTVNWTTGERAIVLDTIAEVVEKVQLANRSAYETCPNPIGNLTALVEFKRAQLLESAEVEPWRKVFSAIASDVVKGQIITTVVVVLFVVCFLLREWILMNGPLDNRPPAPVAVPEAAPAPLLPADLNERPRLDVEMVEGERAAAQERLDALMAALREMPQAPQPDLRRANLPADAGLDHPHLFDEPPRFDPALVHHFNAFEAAEPSTDREPVASTSRLNRDNSPSGSSAWTDLSDEEVEMALTRPRPRHRSRSSRSHGGATETHDDAEGEDADDDGPASWRANRRGLAEASRRRREDRPRRDDRPRRRASRPHDAAGPSSPTAGSPDRPIRPLPRRQTHSPERPRLEDRPPTPYRPPSPADAAPPLPPAFNAAPPLPQPQDAVLPPLFLPPVQIINLPGPAEADGDLGDEEPWADDVFLDDFEGVLDAIGMRGSLLTLVQNLGLMVLLLTLCLGGAVWLPLCLGRVLAAADASRLVTMPLRAVRSLSDPLFDALFSVVTAIPIFLFRTIAPKALPLCTKLPTALSAVCTHILGSPAALNATASTIDSTAATNATIAATATVAAARPVAATALKKALKAVAHHWSRMAFDDDNLHLALCTALGYATVLLSGVWYLQITSNEYSQSVNKAIRDGVKQQLTLLKVCLFVIIEIILFPATCGTLLNLATLPLFPDASIATRLAFFARQPVAGFFISWLSGTCYMVCFSATIDAVRDTVRDGLVWFVRDPNSSEFSPIKDILEKSSLVQLRKIGTSVLLYGAVVFFQVGASIYFLRYACGSALPLRWPSIRPFTVPIDLILYRFLIPATIRAVDPRARINKLFSDWAKRTAHELRLTSFIFGTRVDSEEGTHVRRTWRARLTLKKADVTELEAEDEEHQPEVSPREVVFRKDGGWGRVPAVDTVRVVAGRTMLVRVTEDGQALDKEGAKIIVSQTVEMATSRPKDKYMIVYLPPNFRTRISLFVYLLWFTSSLALCSALLAPLLVGRYLFSMATSTPVHDFYTVVLGCYVLGTLSYVVHRRPSSVQFVLPTRQQLRRVRAVVTTFFLGIVLLPLFFALDVEAILYLPVSHLFPSTSAELAVPTIHVLHSWAMGTLGLSLMYHLYTSNFTPRTDPWRASFVRFQSLWTINHRLLALELLNAEVIVPFTRRVAIRLLVPAILTLVWQGLFGGPLLTAARIAYGCIALGRIAPVLNSTLGAATQRWLDRKLEEEFLVERKLLNYVPEQQKKEDGEAAEADITVYDEGGVLIGEAPE